MSLVGVMKRSFRGLPRLFGVDCVFAFGISKHLWHPQPATFIRYGGYRPRNPFYPPPLTYQLFLFVCYAAEAAPLDAQVCIQPQIPDKKRQFAAAAPSPVYFCVNPLGVESIYYR
jgi:hypothetical protein